MTEAELALAVFARLLRQPTEDGARKLEAGQKTPWWIDNGHEAGLFSHISRWKKGEKRDPDSGSHPLVHVAWRALALAYQEMRGKVKPGRDDCDAEPGKVWIPLPPYLAARLDAERGSGTEPWSPVARCFSCGETNVDHGSGIHLGCRGRATEPVHGPSTPGHPDYLGGISESGRFCLACGGRWHDGTDHKTCR